MLVFVFFATLTIAIVLGKPGLGTGDQDWGYEEVRKGAHMFWWLYYTTADVHSHTKRPLIIWLQGGPGASSTGYGNICELGPQDIDSKYRNFTWVKNANVLFIDNPVGSGFSYVEKLDLLTTTNKQIADDLVELVRKVFKKNPEFIDVPLYVMSQSYGGKMAVEFVLELTKAVQENSIAANLKGVGLGNSWISPVDSILTWAPFLLQVGTIDHSGFKAIDERAQMSRKMLEAGQYVQATREFQNTETVLAQQAHGIDMYNYLTKMRSHSLFATSDCASKLDKFMNGHVRKSLGVKPVWGKQSESVFRHLEGDFMKSATDIVEELLNTTDVKVFVYSGVLDIIVDTPGTINWVNNLRWPKKHEWQNASRTAISVNGFNEGYRKSAGNLVLYWVNRAGHSAPADNHYLLDALLRDLTNDYQGIL